MMEQRAAGIDRSLRPFPWFDSYGHSGTRVALHENASDGRDNGLSVTDDAIEHPKPPKQSRVSTTIGDR